MMKIIQDAYNVAFVNTVIYLAENRVAKTMLDGGAELAEIRKNLREHFRVVMQRANIPVRFHFVQEIIDYVESELNDLMPNS